MRDRIELTSQQEEVKQQHSSSLQAFLGLWDCVGLAMTIYGAVDHSVTKVLIGAGIILAEHLYGERVTASLPQVRDNINRVPGMRHFGAARGKAMDLITKGTDCQGIMEPL